MDRFIYNQELADFIKEGLKQIQWLDDIECIDERELDDVLCCLKDHFEGSKFAEGNEGEDFDYWYDDFCEETLIHYFFKGCDNMRPKPLIEMLVEAGYLREDIHHHNSDLYVYVTPLTTRVLEDWCRANGWKEGLVKEKSYLFDTFTDNITGRKMYDIAFQYIPWWEERCGGRS